MTANAGSRGTAQRPLTVLHALRTADPAAGGFVTYLSSLRQGLADRPIELRVESVFPHSSNWRVVALRHPLQFLGRVKRQLRDSDVLHVHGIFGWHVLLSVWAANTMGRAYAITLHGHLHPDALRERRMSKQIYLAFAGRRMLERASVVIVTTPAERDILLQSAPRAHVEEVMPGLQVPATPKTRPDSSDDTSSRPLNVLYLGRLHPHKGLHRVVKAMNNARVDGLDAVLTVAGSGRRGYRRSVARQAQDLGLAEHVHFLGHVDAERRAALFADADVFVLPSQSENFGFAVAEAMAAGVPVIISNNVGLASLVEEQDCGRVVPVGDVDALGRALLEYTDPALRQDHGRRAHAAAREAFSIPKMGTVHEAIYRRIASQAD